MHVVAADVRRTALYRDRIHVRAIRQRRAITTTIITTAVDHRHHPVASHTGRHLQAGGPKAFGHKACGVLLLPGELGPVVYPPAQRDQVHGGKDML